MNSSFHVGLNDKFYLIKKGDVFWVKNVHPQRTKESLALRDGEIAFFLIKKKIANQNSSTTFL